jgi:hypothetical protein
MQFKIHKHLPRKIKKRRRNHSPGFKIKIIKEAKKSNQFAATAHPIILEFTNILGSIYP